MRTNASQCTTADHIPSRQLPTQLSSAAGMVAQTKVLTLDGELPVNELVVGQKLITRDSGIARILQINRLNCKIRTVFFTGGSLGHTRPDCDTLLAAHQLILIRDWRAHAMFGTDRALVAACALIDHEFILDCGVQKTEIFQIFCDTPHILYAGGLELGTADAGQMAKVASDVA